MFTVQELMVALEKTWATHCDLGEWWNETDSGDMHVRSIPLFGVDEINPDFVKLAPGHGL